MTRPRERERELRVEEVEEGDKIRMHVSWNPVGGRTDATHTSCEDECRRIVTTLDRG